MFVFLCFAVMAFGFSVPITIFNVYIGYKNKTLKQTNLWESFRPLISLAILFCFTTFWAAYSPTNVIETDPRMFYFMVGTLFSNICVKYHIFLFLHFKDKHWAYRNLSFTLHAFYDFLHRKVFYYCINICLNHHL